MEQNRYINGWTGGLFEFLKFCKICYGRGYQVFPPLERGGGVSKEVGVRG